MGDDDGELCRGAVNANENGRVEFGTLELPLSISALASTAILPEFMIWGLGGGGGVSKKESGTPAELVVYADERDAELDRTRDVAAGLGSTE